MYDWLVDVMSMKLSMVVVCAHPENVVQSNKLIPWKQQCADFYLLSYEVIHVYNICKL